MTSHRRESPRYPSYVLAVLVLVYIFNFIDRQILSILAEEIKADLGLSDASLGFLFGTAFAVFYAIFGIPLGRLADIWNRKNVIAIGLFAWSAMTALSGTARGFASLAAYRIGVGIGESSASPAAFSMLGDYFPPRRRATAVAVYSSGVFIGSGIGMFLGGWIVDAWNRAFPAGGPLGLVGWQAAFFGVGLPGLAMAVWVWTLREPVRGASEGLPVRHEHPHPFRELVRELAAILPPLTAVSVARGHLGARGLAFNLAVAAACALSAWGLIALTGDHTQWIALAIGLYAFFSWLQGLAARDRPAFVLIYRSRAMVFGMLGFGFMSFVGYGMGFWFAPYFIRTFDTGIAEVGTALGLVTAVAGWMSVSSGGIFSDWLKARNPRARLLVGMGTAVVAASSAHVFLNAARLSSAYILVFVFQLSTAFWIGSAVALANEIVIPRLRGSASAFYLLSMTFVGLALGPYTIGKLSDRFAQAGMSAAEALHRALVFATVAYGIAFVCFWIASHHVQREESTRLERARAAGEPVDEPADDPADRIDTA
ncbi:MAG: spinster family MFS transporter [Thermoanaerobaculia bacterium]